MLITCELLLNLLPQSVTGDTGKSPEERGLGVIGRNQSGGCRDTGVSEWTPGKYCRIRSTDRERVSVTESLVLTQRE